VQRQSVQESLVLERVQLAERRNSQLRSEVASLESDLQRARSQVHVTCIQLFIEQSQVSVQLHQTEIGSCATQCGPRNATGVGMSKL
jgi:hypothetical protein